jgi:hypothetical protein
MTMVRHAAWKRHLDGIADEIVRLSAICDIDLRAPGAIDRVLQGDQTVCGRKNAIAFGKLRRLLAATYESLNKVVGRIGTEGARAITDEIVARVDRHRTAGGQPPGHGRKPFAGS